MASLRHNVLTHMIHIPESLGRYRFEYHQLYQYKAANTSNYLPN